MIKKVLVAIPHSDDEISLVGTILNQFIENNVEVIAVFVTNGDYDASVSEIRMKETLEAVHKMNFTRVHFLGYPDNPGKGYVHIFDIKNEYLYSSISGKTETYGIGQTVDYRYKNSEYHNRYYLRNIELDLRDCVLEEKADLLIYPDWDVHPDHRMTSILMDAIVAELIKTHNYRPMVLKKFAYAGVWFGKRDYYYYPMQETILDEIELFPNDLSQAIRVRVDESIYPLRIWKSPIYEYCKAYKTQNAVERCERIVNADALYFYKDTSNLAISAQVQVSSGNSVFINDFKTIIPKHIIDCNTEIQNDFFNYSWIPDSNDTQREIRFLFDQCVNIKQISFNLPHALVKQKIKVLISLDNGVTTEYSFSEKIRNTYTFDELQVDIYAMSIRVVDFSGTQCGFSEIEIYDKESLFPWTLLPVFEYKNNPAKRNLLVGKGSMLLYKAFLYWKYELLICIKKVVKDLIRKK